MVADDLNPGDGGGGPKTSQRDYWQFYWPLALMSLATVVARQFQNATLARYPDAKRELAVFAVASSVFVLFRAALAFVPQLTNVLARSGRSRRVCFRFIAAVCLGLTVPLVFLGFTPAGRAVIAGIFDIDGQELADVIRYLRCLTPLIVVGGLGHYYTGLLVQARRTGTVAVLNALFLLVVLGMLVTGFMAGWRPVTTLVLAQGLGLTVHLLISWLAYRRLAPRGAPTEEDEISYRKALAFFWPVALTGVMFSLSRPIIYSFAGRTADPQTLVAALKVGFDLGMIFQMLVNQFRHVFVTFGRGDLPGLRRFMIRILIGTMAAMLLVAATPLRDFLLGRALGVRGEMLEMSGQVFCVLCLVPPIITWRNYYHGLAMIHRRTGGMSVGGICRNATVLVLAWTLFRLGMLVNVTAALVLVCAFFVDASAVILATRGWRREEA